MRVDLAFSPCKAMDVLPNWTVVSFHKYMYHHIVQPKYIPFLFANHTSVKLEGKSHNLMYEETEAEGSLTSHLRLQ